MITAEVTTVGELADAIKGLPRDMPICRRGIGGNWQQKLTFTSRRLAIMHGVKRTYIGDLADAHRPANFAGDFIALTIV